MRAECTGVMQCGNVRTEDRPNTLTMFYTGFTASLPAGCGQTKDNNRYFNKEKDGNAHANARVVCQAAEPYVCVGTLFRRKTVAGHSNFAITSHPCSIPISLWFYARHINVSLVLRLLR